MEDDPRTGSGVFAEDQEWKAMRAQQRPQERRSIRQINRDWKAHYS